MAPAVVADVASTPTPTQRALLVFHEARDAGATAALLAVAPELRRRGWTLDGIFTSGGAPIAGGRDGLASVVRLERPAGVSLESWRRPPDALASLRAAPLYLRTFLRILRERNPHVIHCTAASVPEAIIARILGFAVVIAVPDATEETLRGSRRPTLDHRTDVVELAYQAALQERFAPRFARSRDARG